MRCTLEERFWSKVGVEGPDDCWIWRRGLNDSGYGQFKLIAGGSPKRASRVAWLLTYGDPGSSLVLHKCDNPPCCNPAHLFLGTHFDNNADMTSKGRRRVGPQRDRARQIARLRHLTDEQIAEAHRRHAAGESRRSIARSFGVANTTIDDLINGKTWRSEWPSAV